MSTAPFPEAETTYDDLGHQLDELFEPIHIDIDPFIPTGKCAICSNVPQETLAPEDRAPCE